MISEPFPQASPLSGKPVTQLVHMYDAKLQHGRSILTKMHKRYTRPDENAILRSIVGDGAQNRCDTHNKLSYFTYVCPHQRYIYILLLFFVSDLGSLSM